MNDVSIERLVALLARSEALPSPRGSVEGIAQPAEAPTSFVEPRFELSSEESKFLTAVPSVLMISAPAAVGKSWLARELSARSKNPLWNLSKFRLGSHFFTGTIAQVFGGAGYAEIEDRMRHGQVTLILDAADEAVVGSGLTNFEAAIADLAGLIGSPNDLASAAVILGRPDTLELVGVLLEENEVSWQLWHVDYFDEDKSLEFVRTKIEAHGTSNLQEVDDFLDDFFVTVKQALGQQSVPHREFLGYAPVLDAVASFYVSHRNPFATFQEIKRSKSSAHVWALLRQVVSSICDRETDKLAGTLSGDEVLVDLARELYSVSRQIDLLTQASLDSVPFDFPEDLSSAARQRFVDAARTQLSEHPFLRRQADRTGQANPFLRFGGVMFRDFVGAETMLASSGTDAAILSADMLHPDVVASPALARFLAAGLTEESLLPSEILPALMESVASDDTAEPVSLVVEEIEDEANLRDDVLSINLSLAILARGHELARCNLRHAHEEPVQLGRSAARTLIDVPNLDVLAPPSNRDMLLGDSVNVVGRHVTLDAPDVRVQANADAPVRIRTEAFDSRTLRLFVGRPDSLLLRAPLLRHPWQSYAWEGAGDSAISYAVYDAAYRFRVLFRWFARSSMTGRLTYPASTMDTIIAKRRVDWSVFFYLQSQDFIERQGDIYRLTEPIATRDVLAMNLAKAEYVALLKKFCTWEQRES